MSNTNIGVTAATLLPSPSVTAGNDGVITGETALAPRYNYTKLFFNYFNPFTAYDNQTDYEIMNFPPSFFRAIQYTLVTRTISTVLTPGGYQYNKAKIVNKIIVFDDLASSVASPTIFNNTIDNLTTGDLELNNVVNLPYVSSTVTSIGLSYNTTDDRFYLTLLKLKAQEKASIFIELF